MLFAVYKGTSGNPFGNHHADQKPTAEWGPSKVYKHNEQSINIDMSIGYRAGQDNVTGQSRNRIVGGHDVERNSLPWQVRMHKLDLIGVAQCGAAIICPKFVLTAGHCLRNHAKNLSAFEIYIGGHNVQFYPEEYPPGKTSRHEIVARHVHPKYHDFRDFDQEEPPIEDGIDYDISILEVNPPIKMRPEARAIFLPTPEDVNFNADSKFVNSGWGYLYEGGRSNIPLILQSVTMPWISDAECRKLYAQPEVCCKGESLIHVTESNICAGDIDKGKIGFCNGDSGGPMAWLDPKTEEVKIIGIVSLTYGCGYPNSPNVFAKVTSGLDWIKSITGNCNEDTCSAGNCMTKDKLTPKTIENFQTVTPHK